MSDVITVSHLGEDRFAIEVRGHTITVDQPVGDGGHDSAPTPTELFLAGLAGCIAHYARRYLARHSLPSEGLTVTADYTMGSRPNRITDISVRITPPVALPADRRDAFLAVASGCTVHNTLHHSPEIAITLEHAPTDLAPGGGGLS